MRRDALNHALQGMVRVAYKSNFVLRILMLCVVSGGPSLTAGPDATAESVAVRTVQLAIGNYRSTHNGESPTNWDQLQQARDIDALNGRVYPIKEHYVFIYEKVPVPGDKKGDVLLIRTDAETNRIHSELGRYFISTYKGDAIVNWFPESKVRVMFREAGLEGLLGSMNNSEGGSDPGIEAVPGPTFPHLERTPREKYLVNSNSTSPVFDSTAANLLEPRLPKRNVDGAFDRESSNSQMKTNGLWKLLALVGICTAPIIIVIKRRGRKLRKTQSSLNN